MSVLTLRFHPVHTNEFSKVTPGLLHCFAGAAAFKIMHFQESLLLKGFSKVFVLVFVFLHYRVDGNRRSIKKYTFSKENALVWMRPKTSLFSTYCKPNHVFQKCKLSNTKGKWKYTHENIIIEKLPDPTGTITPNNL